MNPPQKTIVLGGGCFWCVEAVFQNFNGVLKSESGYAGGKTENPTYEDVSHGNTGHAEVIRLTYDPAIISLEKIFTIFFHAHDPTTKDRQGNDVGTQYRSVIFYNDDDEKALAMKVKAEIEQAKVWADMPIVTEIEPLQKFYMGEGYHQNYFKNNGSQPYCSFVIAPKVKKIRKEFSELLKEN